MRFSCQLLMQVRLVICLAMRDCVLQTSSHALPSSAGESCCKCAGPDCTQPAVQSLHVEAHTPAAVPQSSTVSPAESGSRMAAGADAQRAHAAVQGVTSDPTADLGNPEQPQLQSRAAPLVQLSQRSLASVRLALALCAGWLWGVRQVPHWPLPLVVGSTCLALLALAWVPGRGVDTRTGPNSSRASLLGMVYSLAPAPVQKAVTAAGMAIQAVEFVFEPVAAAVAFAAVLDQMT